MEFYISQTKADNHAVREAACACIAELGIKVSGVQLIILSWLLILMSEVILIYNYRAVMKKIKMWVSTADSTPIMYTNQVVKG